MRKYTVALVCSLLLIGTVGRGETINSGTFYVSVSQSEFLAMVQQESGIMGQLLGQFRAEGLSGGVTLVNDHTARIWASGGGVTAEAYVINNGGGVSGAGPGGSASPASNARIAIGKVIRRQIFVQAEPESPPPAPAAPGQAEGNKPRPRMPGRATSTDADVFFDTWSVGDLDGNTFGFNPSLSIGGQDEFTFTMPVQIISPSEGDAAMSLGLDGAWRHSFKDAWEKWAAGVHAYVLGSFSPSDTSSTLGGGPFLSYHWRINKKWIVSAGGLLEFTEPSEGDSDTELVPGVNVGYNLSERVAVNGYVLRYWSLNSGSDSYTDLGGDVQWRAGTWCLSAGVKTSQGLSDTSDTEFYLGSIWRF